MSCFDAVITLIGCAHLFHLPFAMLTIINNNKNKGHLVKGLTTNEIYIYLLKQIFIDPTNSCAFRRKNISSKNIDIILRRTILAMSSLSYVLNTYVMY